MYQKSPSLTARGRRGRRGAAGRRRGRGLEHLLARTLCSAGTGTWWLRSMTARNAAVRGDRARGRRSPSSSSRRSQLATPARKSAPPFDRSRPGALSEIRSLSAGFVGDTKPLRGLCRRYEASPRAFHRRYEASPRAISTTERSRRTFTTVRDFCSGTSRPSSGLGLDELTMSARIPEPAAPRRLSDRDASGRDASALGRIGESVPVTHRQTGIRAGFLPS